MGKRLERPEPRSLWKRMTGGVGALALTLGFLTLGVAQPAAAASGSLDVRAVSVDCGFTNVVTAETTQCADVPGVWYPSEPANHQAIASVGGTVEDCVAAVSTPAENLTGVSASLTESDCNGRTHSTENLLASIFSGTDANGLPDVPKDAPWPTRAADKCRVSAPNLTDIGQPTCGIGTNGRGTAEWYVLEGYLYLPGVPDGQITVRANNTDAGGTARANYFALMVSDDDTFAKLRFRGEAQTAFQRTSNVDFSLRSRAVEGSQCFTDVRAFRLYMQDNIEGSAASLTWNIGGDRFEAIDPKYFGTDATPTDGCVPPAATPDRETTAPGVPVTLDVLANDTPGVDEAPLDPSTVRLIDPVSGEPAESVTVPGEGTWTVDTTTGRITFTPEAGFTGETTTLDYVVQDTLGQTARSTVVVTVEDVVVPAKPPVATDDAGTTAPRTPIALDVLANDTPGDAPLDPTTVRLIDPETGEHVLRVVVPGEGTWTVDPDSGVVTFLPVDGFTGKTTPVGYVVADENGLVADAEIVVTVADEATTPVTPPKGESGGELATTGGSDLTPLALLGALMIVLGAGTLALRFRRA